MVVYFSGSWKILSGNEIATLLGWWLMECHKKKHPGDMPGWYMFPFLTFYKKSFTETSRSVEVACGRSNMCFVWADYLVLDKYSRRGS